MALSRAELIAEVANELAGVLTLAGFTAADTAGNMREPTNRAFRALGVGQNVIDYGQAPDGEEDRWLAYLRYFTLDKAVYATAKKMNVKMASLREQHENLLRLRSAALAEAQAYGLPLPGNGQSGAIPIPYAGGIDAADYEALADDGTRLSPLFSLGALARAEAW